MSHTVLTFVISLLNLWHQIKLILEGDLIILRIGLSSSIIYILFTRESPKVDP